jgi:hypothetical protein
MDSKNILSELRDRVAAKRGQGVYRKLAALSGGEFSYSWVRGFAQGLHTNPTMRRVEALRVALDQMERDAA